MGRIPVDVLVHGGTASRRSFFTLQKLMDPQLHTWGQVVFLKYSEHVRQFVLPLEPHCPAVQVQLDTAFAGGLGYLVGAAHYHRQAHRFVRDYAPMVAPGKTRELWVLGKENLTEHATWLTEHYHVIRQSVGNEPEWHTVWVEGRIQHDSDSENSSDDDDDETSSTFNLENILSDPMALNALKHILP